MSPKHHRLPVTRTAHYYTLGTASPNTKRCWIVCHGYGQLAEHFINKFDEIAGEEDYIIAPEGLSRFYWGGLAGKVVASWMTKGNRLDEINDYCNMLSTIYQDEVAGLADDVEVILFGFSQGCATQVRWLHRDQPHFDQLWLWGGFIPEDLVYTDARTQDYLAGKTIHHFRGDADPLIKEHYIEMHRELIKNQQLEIQEHQYKGDHRVVRKELARFVDGLL